MNQTKAFTVPAEGSKSENKSIPGHFLTVSVEGVCELLSFTTANHFDSLVLHQKN